MKEKARMVLQAALKSLAQATLRRYRPRIVGVTGNTGKTSAKNAIEAVLSARYRVRGAGGNFNNELGLPLAILGGWKRTGGVLFWLRVLLSGALRLIAFPYPRILVLEYGIDHPGDMDYLIDITKPDVAVMTAIGDVPVHIEFFKDVDELAREKGKLLEALPSDGHAIVNGDDPRVVALSERTKAKALTYGFEKNAEVRVSGFEHWIERDVLKGVTFRLEHNGSLVPVRLTGVLGRPYALAAAAGAAVGLIFDMNLVDIAEALEASTPLVGRERLLDGKNGSVLIDDTYNASPLAVEAALHALKEVPAERRIAVLGDMLELGRESGKAHRAIGHLAASSADVIVTVGEGAKGIAKEVERAKSVQVHSFERIPEAVAFLEKEITQGDVVLIKGSQSARMEKVVLHLMAEPERAGELLVRQSPAWLKKPGMYN